MAVNNRATRFNRGMMFGTLVLGLLVIGVCMGFLYYSYDLQEQKNNATTSGDSIRVTVDDPSLLED